MHDSLIVLISLIVGISLGIAIFYFLKKRGSKSEEEISETIEDKLTELLPIVLSQANESLVRMANEKLGSETKHSVDRKSVV